jgi:phosphoserine phosphatase
MTTLYITRHGETEWNIQKRMQGWLDSPLTELGKRQAEWLGERLQRVNIDIVYSSPLGRAYTTSEIICKDRKIDIIKNEDFREIDLGAWEGLRQEEIEVFDEEQLKNFWHAPGIYMPSKGESFHDVISRTHKAVQQILTNHKGQTILIVTHAAAAKAIMYHYENRTLEQFWEPPFMHQTSLSQIEVDEDKHKVVLHADITHYKNN